MSICHLRIAVGVGLFFLGCASLFNGPSNSGDKRAARKESSPQNKQEKVDQQTIRNLIKQLGDDSFEKREEADKQLSAVGEPALELLQQAAKDNKDPEIRQRAQVLARRITSSFVRQLRTFVSPNKAPSNYGSTRVVVTPDGKKIIAANSDGLHWWDLESGKELVAITEIKSTVWSLAVSPDGGRVLAGSNDKIARLFDLETGKKLQQFVGQQDTVQGAVFLPGGNMVLTGSRSPTLRIWDSRTGQKERDLEGAVDNIRCLAVAPDGMTFVASHFARQQTYGVVRLWDIESGKPIRTYVELDKEIPSVDFSPDGKLLLGACLDKTLRVWETDTGKELHRMTGSPLQFVEWAQFTPDGKRIVSCGTGGEGNNYDSRTWTLRIWDVGTGKVVLESEDVRGGVLCLAVLPDGRRCVTASRDGVVRLWGWEK
jgi:dipeptidyl aminopeptidase/acylaminoacyl peptidase